MNYEMGMLILGRWRGVEHWDPVWFGFYQELNPAVIPFQFAFTFGSLRTSFLPFLQTFSILSPSEL